MKRLATLVMTAVLATALATPALAKKDVPPAKGTKAEAYEKASAAEKKRLRAATMEKATLIHQKRAYSRQQVDILMQERLRNMQSDSAGNVGPIGGQK